MGRHHPRPYEQPSASPTPKIASVGVGGAAGVVLVHMAWRLGIELPLDVAASMVAIVAWTAGYFRRDRV